LPPLRISSSLAFLLLLATAGRAHAKPVTAAIADLKLGEPTGSQLIDSIRTDLSVSHYSINEKPELLRGLQGKIPDAERLQKAAALLQASQEAYENFKLEEALRSLQKVSALLRDAASEERERELLAQRYLLAGLVRMAQERSAKALNNFRLAHRLRPDQDTLDAGRHRPSVVSMYEEAVQQNKSASAAKLVRAWEPASAVLYVDGRALGSADKLSQGPHIFTLTSEGYESASVALSLGASTTHEVKLRQLSLTEQLQRQRVHTILDTSSDAARFEKLAELAAVDFLVLVRGGPEGPRGAIYDRANKSLSAWVTIGSVRWESLLSREESSAAAMDLQVSSQRSADEPWFKQWWGGGLIVGGTAIVGTAIYFALSASESSDREATIDQWCFGSCK
jgi:tetratricopeptide (TPR) repeat protein